MSNTVALKVSILGNTIVDIDDIAWHEGMNATAVLESAYNMREDKEFLFSLAYYGYDQNGNLLGYFVEEIEQIGDQPNVYWQFAVNGNVSDQGIDQVRLRDGDVVSFTYSYWSDSDVESPQLAAKHERFQRRAQLGS